VEKNLVVARYLDGRTVKGFTEDFFPERPAFRVQSRTEDPQIVRVRDLKAVFVVRDLAGDPTREKGRSFPENYAPEKGKKVAVLFKDGELLVGYTLTYLPGKQGFFVFPADADGNNLRVYVVSEAARQIRLGPAADQLLQVTPRKPPPGAAAGPKAAPPAGLETAADEEPRVA
jgi:hypothetical protein